MNAHDGNVNDKDFQDLKREVARSSWSQIALNVFAREPRLAEQVANRWAKINVMLEGMGLSEEQRVPVLRQVGRLVIESLAVTQRSGRRLWNDLMPAQEDGSHE